MLRAAIMLVAAGWVAADIALFVVPRGQKPIHADAVVVLSGSPTRLPKGLALVRAGWAPLLVVSRSTDPTRLELRACAHELDVPVLCRRADPYSTEGEAKMVRMLAERRGWTAVDVVTSRYHVFRARLLLRRCYRGRLRVVAAPNQTWMLPADAVLEGLKLVYHEVVHRGC
jgi:uncharacterized SAM-binding protein YcdF (DUF218 family)